MIEEYIAAFQTCYPGKTVELRPKKVRGQILWRVVIDHDAGDVMLSDNDVREATRLFKRGK